MIMLVKPNKTHEKEIFEYKQEMIEYGNDSLSGCGGLHKTDVFDDWLKHILSYNDRKKIPKNSSYVEGSQWILIDTNRNRVLGMVNIRHYLNDFLIEFGGHVGYSIRPTERMKGYGKMQLLFALDYLRKFSEKKVLITCDEDNVGSYKTIEACGGILENILFSNEHGNVRRYWINLEKDTF